LLLLVGKLLETLGVHERVRVSRRIQELHLPLLQIGLLKPLPGPERPIKQIAGLVAFQFGSHECSPLAGLDVLKLDDVIGLSLEFETSPVAKIPRRNHESLPPFPRRGPPASLCCGRPRRLEMLDRGLDSEQIPCRAEPGDLAQRDPRDVGPMPKLLA